MESDQTQAGESGLDNSQEKQIFIDCLTAGDKIQSSFLVQSKQLMVSRAGKSYLTLTMADKTGRLDTRIWNDAERISETFEEGDVVAICGKVHLFQNRLQLIGDQVVRVPAEEVDLSLYLPCASQDLEALYEQLVSVFEGVENPWVRELALSLLRDPEIAPRYKVCPAAKTIHHAFIGGLLTHSLQLIQLADSVLPHYENIDRSIVLFGAAFHDFGKIFELTYDGPFGYSDEGRLVGHISIGTTLIDRKILEIENFPKEMEFQLKHIILSHHGRLEYGSPKRPATLEAQLVHHLDDMDSKINSIQTHMKAENSASRWTGHHRAYDQYYYKPDACLTP